MKVEEMGPAEMILNDYAYFSEYEEFVRQTDLNPEPGAAGLNLPLLGLFGEVGSLLSELKKKLRDADSYIGYHDSVIEEFGDALWYFTNVALRAGQNINILAQRMFREIDDWDEVDDYKFGGFGDIQPSRETEGPINYEKFEHGLIVLAGKVGRLLDDVASGHTKGNRDVLSSHLVEIFRAFSQAAEDAEIDLEDVIKRNVIKISSRWPVKQIYTDLFDEDIDLDEQLPRHIEMEIRERTSGGRTFVIQKYNGVIIGDRLTDNRTIKDDYRFHDVFHLAYLAILGWSPVIRSLLKLKRKSKPEIDENEDGARAMLIEEGVATLIFNHGIRLNYFASINSVDYSMLKSIKEFVKGYEVEICPLWQWEKAILEGFKVFRFLHTYRKGLVIVDLPSRSISIQPLN